jgi:hypothetical protein
MVLGFDQPLTVTSRVDNLITFMWCPEIWEPQTPGTFWECNRPVMGFLHPLYTIIYNLSCEKHSPEPHMLLLSHPF